MGTVATVAAVLASAGALVAVHGSEPPSTPLPSPALSEAPGLPEKASELLLTGAADGGRIGDSASATPVATVAAQIELPPAEPSPTPLPTAIPSTPETPDPVASSSSATPQPVPQAPVPMPQPVADRLVQEAAQRFGIQIVLDGQDWGEGEAAQTTNIGAVISAMERLPQGVVSAVTAHAHGPLTYTTIGGSTVTLSPPNPLEAFAVAGSVYYTRPSGMPLPDWPEYWDWFQANLG